MIYAPRVIEPCLIIFITAPTAVTALIFGYTIFNASIVLAI